MKIDKMVSQESINTIYEQVSSAFDEKSELADILKVYNDKGLKEVLNHVFEVKHYCKDVINLMKNKSDFRDKVIEALQRYLPELP